VDDRQEVRVASDASSDAPAGKYRIGTVSTLTGLSTHTIRAWERRYGVVEPSRSPSGLRLYGDADVSRLQLLRALTDCGEAIGEVARLPDASLRERLARHADEARGPRRPATAIEGPARALLLDPTLPDQLAVAPADAAALDVAGVVSDRPALERRLGEETVDVVIASLEFLGPDPAETVERLGELAPETPVLVLYGYATRGRLAHLAGRGAHLLKRPANAAAVRRAVADALAIHGALGRPARPAPPSAHPPEPGRTPPRIFDDRQLAMLQEIRSSVDCECPNHLSGIVGSLVAFERYSRECESKSPEDADLHATLAEGTARARVVMERLLAHLCDQDDIAV
jgi:DNA-binding transcriptional MerR regulator